LGTVDVELKPVGIDRQLGVDADGERAGAAPAGTDARGLAGLPSASTPDGESDGIVARPVGPEAADPALGATDLRLGTTRPGRESPAVSELAVRAALRRPGVESDRDPGTDLVRAPHPRDH